MTSFEKGVEAARYFGAEFQANPGSNRQEYLDSCANYFGKDCFRDLGPKEKGACRDAFNAGIKAEKELQ